MKKDQMRMDRLPQEQQDASKVIVLANNKGGCGKTSTAIALGMYYVRMGKNVMFVDADPQSNLTQRMGLSDEKCQDKRIGQLFLNAHIAGYEQAQRKMSQIVQYPYIYRVNTSVEKTGKVGLIPGEHGAEIEADAAEKRLANNRFIDMNKRDIAQYYRRCIDFYRGYFNFIIIDTAPALEGNILNRVSVQAADDIVCPVDGLEAALGLYQLMDVFRGLTASKHPNVLFSMIKYQEDPASYGIDITDTRLRNSVYRAMKDTFGDFVCDFGVKEQPGLRRNVAMFGRKTDYIRMCQEISGRLSSQRQNIFDVMTRDKYGAFELVLEAIGKKARNKDPRFKVPRYAGFNGAAS
jgi:cellulose biosynthesis protein BcsQ